MKVLVIDDEPAVVEVVSEVLRARGHNVHTASDVAGARALVSAEPYDAIVIDVAMPKVSGLAFYEELERARSPMVDRMIVICAASTPTLRASFTRVPPWAFFEKPFEIVRLAAAVERIGSERS